MTDDEYFEIWWAALQARVAAQMPDRDPLGHPDVSDCTCIRQILLSPSEHQPECPVFQRYA